MNRLEFILSIVFFTASSLSYTAKTPMSEEQQTAGGKMLLRAFYDVPAAS